MRKKCPHCQLWLYDRSTLTRHMRRKHQFEVSSSDQTGNETSSSEREDYEVQRTSSNRDQCHRQDST
jgi:hypothetical protein